MDFRTAYTDQRSAKYYNRGSERILTWVRDEHLKNNWTQTKLLWLDWLSDKQMGHFTLISQDFRNDNHPTLHVDEIQVL